MLLLHGLFIATLFQQAVSLVLRPESNSLNRRACSRVRVRSPLTNHVSLVERGCFPSKCEKKEEATELQGCFRFKDLNDQELEVALADGQSFNSGGGIGEGNTGSVAQCVTRNGLDVAVKKYSTNRDSDNRDCERSYKYLRELQESQNIVDVLGKGKIGENPALVMELASDANLAKRIERGDYKGKDKEAAFKEVGLKILGGLAFMHSKNIAHCDIWEDNVAFKGNEPKIIDLDYGCQGDKCVCFVPGGELGLAAPEGLKQPEGQAKSIDPLANDVWTVTIMLIHMTTGTKSPNARSDEARAWWENEDKDKRAELIQKKWPDFNSEFVDVLADVFTKQDKRIKMEALKDDFEAVDVYNC